MELKIGLKLLNIFREELVNNVAKGNKYNFRWYNHLSPNIKKDKWT